MEGTATSEAQPATAQAGATPKAQWLSTPKVACGAPPPQQLPVLKSNLATRTNGKLNHHPLGGVAQGKAGFLHETSKPSPGRQTLALGAGKGRDGSAVRAGMPGKTKPSLQERDKADRGFTKPAAPSMSGKDSARLPGNALQATATKAVLPSRPCNGLPAVPLGGARADATRHQGQKQKKDVALVARQLPGTSGTRKPSSQPGSLQPAMQQQASGDFPERIKAKVAKPQSHDAVLHLGQASV